MLSLWKESYEQPKQHIKKQRHHFSNKGPYKSKLCFFPVVMYRCESWIIKKAECWRIDAFKLQCWRKLFRVPWNARSNQSIPKEINPEYSLEGLILWLPDVKSWLTGKYPDAGKDWGQEEKGTTEDERAGWHHQFNEHGYEQILGDSEGQGSLVCRSPWVHRKSDTT